MTDLELSTLRSAWEELTAAPFADIDLRRLVDLGAFADTWVPKLFDHIDDLRGVIRRAATDEDITHTRAYLQAHLAEALS